MEKPPSPKEPFRQSLQEIAVSASWFKPGQGETQDDVIRAMQPMLTSLLEQTEVPTLKRVVATWAELANWGESLGINNMQYVSASQLSRFYQESKAPSRVLPAMQWMRNNCHGTFRCAWGAPRWRRGDMVSVLGKRPLLSQLCCGPYWKQLHMPLRTTLQLRRPWW